MASTFRFGLARPATTTTATSQVLQHTSSLLSQLTISSQPSSRSLLPAASRLFSTTPLLLRAGLPHQGTPLEADGTPSDLPIPTMSSRDPRIPAYPYGERQVYKQSNRGLYGHARIQFGNNVSEKWGVKTSRKWRPNVRRRRLWSEALRCLVQTRVTARVLRTIDKCGGLDNYLLGDKPARRKELGVWGWKLRWRIMQTDVVQERFRQERIKYGLEPVGVEESLESLQAEGDAAGFSVEDVDARLAAEEEFAIGPQDEPVGKDEGFMKEQRT